jgi:hypothetical protein
MTDSSKVWTKRFNILSNWVFNVEIQWFKEKIIGEFRSLKKLDQTINLFNILEFNGCQTKLESSMMKFCPQCQCNHGSSTYNF